MMTASNTETRGTTPSVVLFDVGGVLLVDFIDEKVVDLAVKYGKDPAHFLEGRKKIRPLADAGTISDQEFWRRLLLENGVEACEEDYEIDSYLQPIAEGMDLVRRLKVNGYRIAILSNDSREMFRRKRDRFGFDALFDEVIVSNEHGFIKPAPEIYRIALERLAIPPAQAIFIDDRADNLTAAKSFGMHAIQYLNGRQVESELQELGVTFRDRLRIQTPAGLPHERQKDSELPFEVSFCLEMLFTILPFMERIEAAGKLGVDHIEFWDYRNKDLQAIERLADSGQITVTNFSGNRLYGMLDPKERAALLQEVTASIAVAKRLHCPRLMLLAQPLSDDGIAGGLPEGASREALIDEFIASASAVGALAEEAGIDMVIEPLNTRIDHPGYFLNHSKLAFDCIMRVNHPRVRLLYDIYHMAAMGESIFEDIEGHLELIGYFHVADLPGRHEPGTGKIDYTRIYNLLRILNYRGVLGFEFSSGEAGSRRAIEQILRSLKCL